MFTMSKDQGERSLKLSPNSLRGEHYCHHQRAMTLTEMGKVSTERHRKARKQNCIHFSVNVNTVVSNAGMIKCNFTVCVQG